MSRQTLTFVLDFVLIIGFIPCAAYAQKVYWTTDTIRRADLDGSNAEDVIAMYRVRNPYGMAIDPTGGKMYWTCGSGRVQRANLDGSGLEYIVTAISGDASGIAVDPDGGKVYWVIKATGKEHAKIRRASLDGSSAETLVTAYWVTRPADVALDLGAGKMYWTDSGVDSIRRSDLDGSNIEVLVDTGLNVPAGIALDLVGGKVYWTDYGNHTIMRADLDGTNAETILSDLDNPWGIVVDSARGRIYWTSRYRNKIRQANLDGSSVEEMIVEGSRQLWGIAIDTAAGKLYVADGFTETIRRADLDGSNAEEFFKEDVEWPLAVALDFDAGKMYWTDPARPGVRRANLDGSNVETAANPKSYYWWSDLAIDRSAGQIYLANSSYGQGTIDRIDLDGSNLQQLVMLDLKWPLGIALDRPANKIYWIAADYHNTGCRIQRANLDGSGLEDLVSGLSCEWTAVQGIALDSAAGKVYWVAFYGYSAGWGIQRANLDGSNVEDVFGITADTVGGIALDLPEGKMYWTGLLHDPEPGGNEGTVQRANLDGSDLETIVADSGFGEPSGITLDLRASGDCDLDSAITLTDYGEFAGCMSGPAASPHAGCGCVNLNGDAYIDLSDFAVFQRVLRP